MSEVEFNKFAICDTCGVETFCREHGEDDQCGGCYWAPINHAKHQAELAALREELEQAKRDRDCEQKACIEAHQRLADAERRSSELEKDAARYIWLRDKSESVHQFYLSTPIWFTGVKFNKENVDRAIDAALNPNPEAASHD